MRADRRVTLAELPVPSTVDARFTRLREICPSTSTRRCGRRHPTRRHSAGSTQILAAMRANLTSAWTVRL